MTGIIPTNAYTCLPLPATPSTPTYIIIGADSNVLYTCLICVIGCEDLVGPDYAHNQHCVAHQAEIEEAISNWTKIHSTQEILAVLDEAGILVDHVVGVKEIVKSKHVKA